MTDVRGTLDTRTLGALRDSVGGDAAFLAELIGDFLDDAPAQLQALGEAARSGDAETARRAAHTLKGNSRTFGADELASLCQQAEAEAKAGELAAVRGRLDAIADEWGRVRAELLAVRDAGA